MSNRPQIFEQLTLRHICGRPVQPRRATGPGLLRVAIVAIIAVSASFILSANTNSAAAQAYPNMSCSQLWFARNQIFANRGFCFKTQRARSVFGRGCFAPFGRLRGFERREVSRIRRWERRRGC